MSFTQREMEQAVGGPITWPTEPLKRILFYRFVCARLRACYGRERSLRVALMDCHGDTATNAAMMDASNLNTKWMLNRKDTSTAALLSELKNAG